MKRMMNSPSSRFFIIRRKNENNGSDEEDENMDYENHAKKISIDDMIKDDYYKVLGLEDLKWRATDDQVRSAYRKLALKYHPDKLASPTPEDRQIFLKIQDAYDTLGNVDKRRAYTNLKYFLLLVMILRMSI